MKYIDAEKLIAEIERRMKCYDRHGCEPNDGKWVELITMKHFVTALQQEQPEVDMKKEYDEYVSKDPVYSKLVNGIAGFSIAKHFFELGQQSTHSEKKQSKPNLGESKPNLGEAKE